MYRRPTTNADRERLIEERDDSRVSLTLATELHSLSGTDLRIMGDRVRELDRQIDELWARSSKG